MGTTSAEYHTPESLTEALGLLARHGDGLVPLAGGTDVVVRLKHGLGRGKALLDLRRLGLDGIAERDGALVLGATTRIAALRSATAVAARAPLLREAVGEFGSPLIRGQATLGGNLGNASPVGDTAPAFIALAAEIVLASAAGRRTLPVAEFLLGPGRTARRPDELILEVRVPFQRGPGAFERLVFRRSLAIAAASVAVVCERSGGAVTAARVAAGAVAPRAVACPQAAAALVGLAVGAEGAALEPALAALARETSPITDPRAGRDYRANGLRGLFREALRRCLAAERR